MRVRFVVRSVVVFVTSASMLLPPVAAQAQAVSDVAVLQPAEPEAGPEEDPAYVDSEWGQSWPGGLSSDLETAASSV